MTTNNNDIKKEVSGITLKDSKNNKLNTQNTSLGITHNYTQTNSDDINVAQANSQDYVKNSHNSEENESKTHKSLTEQWEKGELEVDRDYYLKFADGSIDIQKYIGGFLMRADNEVVEVLAEVPDYLIWKNYVNGYCEEHEYNLRLIEQLEPFTDPYFKGLTTKDIAELAKKSIRLTTQHCKDNEKIEKLRVALLDCKEFLGRSIPPNTLKSIIEDIEEALNG